MKNKNQDKDRFISKMRSPYERVFSKTKHRTRYKGVVKKPVCNIYGVFGI